MGVFEQFPYTNFHDLNLDWILKKMKDLDKEVTEYIKNNKIQSADPFNWNIQSQYPANTLVADPENNTVYLSVQAVPAGVALSNKEYWQSVFTLQALWDALDDVMESVAPINQGTSTQAQQQMEVNELFWLNHNLYIVTSQILRGQEINNTNSRAVTIEEMLLQAQSYLTNKINTNSNDIENLQVTVKNNNDNLNNRISNIVAQAGSDNTEIVDARTVDATKFGVITEASLKDSLDYQFNRSFTGAFGIQGTPTAPYDDLNTFPTNAYYWVQDARTISHLPAEVPQNIEQHLYIACMNVWISDGQQAGTTQICTLDTLKKTWIRTCWAQGWNDWHLITNPENYFDLNENIKKGFISSAVRITNDSKAPYNDLNTIPNNQMMLLLNQDLSLLTISNIPVSTNFASLITINSYLEYSETTPYTASNGQLQIFSDINTGKIYTRTKNLNDWTAWKDITPETAPIINPYHTNVRKPFLFNGKKAAFMGDSITRGFTRSDAITENGFPKLFSKAVGMNFQNLGVGGASLAHNDGYGYIYDQFSQITGTPDYIFIAGGVNDWQLNSPLDGMAAVVKTYCDYLHEHYSNIPVIWITPIEHGVWTTVKPQTLDLMEYRKAITEAIIENDTEHCFSIIQGTEFNFPSSKQDDQYLTYAYGDGLHPTEAGYANIYVPGLLNALT